jgi:hypothetical protein
MPFEENDEVFDELADQTIVVKDLINSNLGSHVIVASDFNVEFTGNRLHTIILDIFCNCVSLIRPVAKHSNYSVDYTYKFNMCRFKTWITFCYQILYLTNPLYQHMLCAMLMISQTTSLLYCMQLHLQLRSLGLNNKIHTPRDSWAKASDFDLRKYQCTMHRPTFS